MQNLSYPEFLDWIQWANQTGFFVPHRLEKSLAYIAMQFGTAMMKKKNGAPFTLEDFQLFAAPKEDQEGTPETVLALLKSLAPKGN